MESFQVQSLNHDLTLSLFCTTCLKRKREKECVRTELSRLFAQWNRLPAYLPTCLGRNPVLLLRGPRRAG